MVPRPLAARSSLVTTALSAFTARRRSYNQQEDSDQRTGSDSIVSIFFVIFVSSVDIFGDATGSRIMMQFLTVDEDGADGLLASETRPAHFQGCIQCDSSSLIMTRPQPNAGAMRWRASCPMQKSQCGRQEEAMRATRSLRLRLRPHSSQSTRGSRRSLRLAQVWKNFSPALRCPRRSL